MVQSETAIRVVWTAWVISWMGAALWSSRTVKRPASRREVMYRLLVAAGAMLLFRLYPARFSADLTLWRFGQTIEWAMMALTVVGFLFTWWARIHLGRLWSSAVTRKADHYIVDTGPYAVVRHPIYTGVMLATLATATARGTAIAWVGAGMMVFGWYVKARLEEDFLREQLGAEYYGQYAKRVPMLVPLMRA
jgi:protein-S-isoprenylcysteine O-methyltransferase Ste14